MTSTNRRATFRVTSGDILGYSEFEEWRPSMLERYETERIGPRQRIRRWCEFGSSTLSSLAVRPYEPAAFSARLLRAVVGELGITEVHTTPAHAVGSGAGVGTWAGGRRSAVLLTCQQAGRSSVLQAGRTVTLEPGDVVMWDLGRPWEVDDSQHTVHLSVKIPADRLRTLFGDFEPYLVAPLRAADKRTQLLSSVIQGIGRLALTSPFPLQSDAVDELLLGAIRVAFDGYSSGSPGLDAVASEQRRLFHFVDERCRDASITVASLAREFGVSLRSFQRAFRQSGVSPRDYLVSKRIEIAAEKLRQLPRCSKAGVTEVALECGFNDPGYFGRVFAKQLGVTPGEFLRRQRSLS